MSGRVTFVGREAELAALDAEWERARAGEFRCVVLVGDAGLGKSRLGERRRPTNMPIREFQADQSRIRTNELGSSIAPLRTELPRSNRECSWGIVARWVALNGAQLRPAGKVPFGIASETGPTAASPGGPD